MAVPDKFPQTTMDSMTLPTVAHKHKTPLICTLLLYITELFFFSAEHFSAITSTFRPCRAAFLLCQTFLFHSERFSAQQSIFQLCWALFCSANHFFVCSEHVSALPSIFSCAQPFSALPNSFLLCHAVHGRAEKYTAEQKNAQHGIKLLGRAEKCSV